MLAKELSLIYVIILYTSSHFNMFLGSGNISTILQRNSSRAVRLPEPYLKAVLSKQHVMYKLSSKIENAQ